MKRIIKTLSKRRGMLCILVCIQLILCTSQLFAQEKSFSSESSIKMTILSLFSGSTKITYEHTLFHHQSIELTGGIIGWGTDILNHSDSKGYLSRLAYKFILPTEKNVDKPLQGFYLKPELAFSSFDYKAFEDKKMDCLQLEHVDLHQSER